MEKKPGILIVGAGPMARSHALAVRHLGLNGFAVCRSPVSAREFTSATGMECRSGGLKQAMQGDAGPRQAIVSVPVEGLLEASLLLLEHGVRRLLVEKPAGLDAAEVQVLASTAARFEAEVYVGYNRRFYTSVQKALAIIEEDDGPTSVKFDFTERSDLVAASNHPSEVKRNWLLANSSHVIDMAFKLAGEPSILHSSVEGSLAWHPAGARFVGSGLTDRGAVFSYHADWEAPGRWSVDVRTRHRRLLLEPLEGLRVQNWGSFEAIPVELPPEALGLKPGILGQLEAFLDPHPNQSLLTIADHARHVEHIYMPILTGRSQPTQFSG